MTDKSTPLFDVLLVEDEPADAHLVKMSFKENRVRCNLHHVWDGVEALAFLRRQGADYADVPRPDLILLDLNMPRMNGREFLAKIKSEPDFSSIPAIVLTTSDIERDVVATYQLGANSYITKPVDVEQFIAAVRQIEGYWFNVVRLPSKQ
ncbi:response regulator [Methylomonas sp. MO1]|uniref:response regulator n=1 Tax=unclassified Methylomonas TaxID=2608980 RepID=UPI00051B9DD9|nr:MULTISPECIES: response regulator [unclassified Methylomonas]MDT4290893.1 response regulator [Methylomonas sp. MO1]PKD37791.1 response regulator [Methylomonas sp. Kb3]QBC28454.1 response regulator [Methylomonas sp. LW13]QSB00125.1 response regulator [Methylomonas sp. EFPC1]